MFSLHSSADPFAHFMRVFSATCSMVSAPYACGNPGKIPNVNAKEAKAFIDWLCGDEAQSIIKDFEV